MKKNILYYLLESVFIIVFNVVFFVLGGAEHPASVWISYVFIHLSYALGVATPFLIRKGKSSSIFGATIYSISSLYFFVEFIIGLIFIFAASESYKAALVIQIILAGLYAILLLINLIANEHTADSEEKREKEIDYIKGASARLKLLLDKADNRKANKRIEKAYDIIHASPTKSNDETKALESEIIVKITELETAVKNKATDDVVSLAERIIDLAEERNAKIK